MNVVMIELNCVFGGLETENMKGFVGPSQIV
jgi:hypothetical protein